MVTNVFKTRNLKLFIKVCGIVVFENLVWMFYTNLHFSKDSEELEILILGIRIVLNYFLFDKVFCIGSTDIIPYINGTCSDNFEVSFEGAKAVVTEYGIDLSYFGSLSLCFKLKTCLRVLITILPYGSLITYIFTYFMIKISDFSIMDIVGNHDPTLLRAWDMSLFTSNIIN